MTLAELEPGVLRATDRGVRASRLATLARVRAEVAQVPIDARAASNFAALVDELAEVHSRSRVNDIWIAATARTLGLPVCTHDTEFDAMPGVEVVHV